MAPAATCFYDGQDYSVCNTARKGALMHGTG